MIVELANQTLQFHILWIQYHVMMEWSLIPMVPVLTLQPILQLVNLAINLMDKEIASHQAFQLL
jgi:hypothetical protein